MPVPLFHWNKIPVEHQDAIIDLALDKPSLSPRELADYLKIQGMAHTRGKPYHPQTQGKIERWQQTMKNQILLDNYYLPEELERKLTKFVHYYNHERYHESLDNLTPADVFYGRGQQKILDNRQLIKQYTMAVRRHHH